MTAPRRLAWSGPWGRRGAGAPGRDGPATAPSLLAKFGVLSLLLFLVLGTVLGQALHRSIQRRVLDGGVREARIVALLAVQGALLHEEVAAGLTPDRARAVRLRLAVDLAPIDVRSVQVWNREGVVVYADDAALIGTTAAPDASREHATGGEPVARIRDLSDSPDVIERRLGQVLEVYVPLRFAHSPAIRPDGAIRVRMPYGPIADAVATDTRRLYVVLAAALAVLYASLFRLVARASARLRYQAAANEHQARHDALTGLPNRTMFRERLAEALAVAGRVDRQLAVVLMDLDRFKEINDTLGHHHGDLLLQEVARRLQRTLRSTDLVARLGGDEFALLLPTVDDATGALAVAGKVRAALERAFDVRGLRLEVGASLGIAMYPLHGDDAETLMQRADVAMYAAKAGHLGHALYDADTDDHSRDRLALSGELRRAIDGDELLLHYQPKLDLRTGDVVGVEALVRWDHPTAGLLGPDRFVPLAERGDLIRPLTRWVLGRALADLATWMRAGHDLTVAVNLSVRNLHGDDLVRTVDDLLRAHGVEPRRLTLEITETMIAVDPERAGQALASLRGLGVRLSIDDFGTGYSSLALLRDLPVQELKIDRSFVSRLDGTAEGSAIVGFSANLGRKLGLDVVAEGIEDDRTAAELVALGCGIGQGYGYSRPLPAAALITWLDERSAPAIAA